MTLVVHGQVTGPFAENTYLAYCAATRRGFIVDPGLDCLGFCQQVIAQADVKVERILLTHAHLDHIFGLAEVKEAIDVPVHLHLDDRFLIDGFVEIAAEWGVQVDPVAAPEESYVDGDKVQVGDVSIQVLHTPGHSPGSVCLFWDTRSGAAAGTPGDTIDGPGTETGLFSGDTIMGYSVGRTDFPRSDADALQRSIREKIFTLPDLAVIYPGHMQETTVADEKRLNSWVRP